jgi:hypothetical protein
MLVRLLPELLFMSVSPGQPANASALMLVTEPGIVSVENWQVQSWNAPSPMLVTVRPLMVDGIVTVPPDPV